MASTCAVERPFSQVAAAKHWTSEMESKKNRQCRVKEKLTMSRPQLGMAKEILHQLEIARDSRDLSPGEEWLRKKLKLHCLGLASLERTIARFCSRILHIREGDANTSFFHQHAQFHRKNFIAKLQVGDMLVTSQEDKHKAVFDFYEQLRGSDVDRNCTLNVPAVHNSQHDLSSLEEPFSEEVWATIKMMLLNFIWLHNS